MLNLFEELGEDVPLFDFRVPGVTSISMDLHKYGFAPKGSSVLLHRDPAVRRAQYFACASWSGYSVVNATMQSTKSGGPLAGAWAVMRYLGREGYLKLAEGMLGAQKQLLTTIDTIDGLRVLGKPSMGLIAIASETIDVFALADELGKKGWFVVPQLSFGNSPRNLHLQVEPGNVPHTADFLKDLRACAKHVQDNPPPELPKPLQQMAAVLTPEMVQTNYKELMGMAGAGGGAPEGAHPDQPDPRRADSRSQRSAAHRVHRRALRLSAMLRIAYARINQETNAFSTLKTTLAEFEKLHYLEGPALRDACRPLKSEAPGLTPIGELTGFCWALRNENVELVPLLSAWTLPSGPLEQTTFETLRDRLRDALEEAGHIDGVYLALHGSMRAEGYDEPEEELLRTTRSVIGDRPLAVSYDLHGLMTPTKVELPDIVTAYRTNPHRDLPQIGARTARLLLRAIRREIRPRVAWRSLPMAFGGGMEVDFLDPMRSIFKRMKRMEKDRTLLFPSLFMVHPFTDASKLGWSTVALTDGDDDLAERVADELAEACWAVKDVPAPELAGPREGIEQARRARWARRLGAVFITDVSDVVGAGGVGDNPNLLAELRDHATDLVSYVPIRDPLALEMLWQRSKGTRVTVKLGATFTPNHGSPCEITGRVGERRDHPKTGRAIAFDAGHLKIVVTEGAPYGIYPSFFGGLGLPLRKADIVVVKSFFHFRIAHVPWVRKHIGIKTRGTTDIDLYESVRHDAPIHPRDPVRAWRPTDRARRS